MILLAHASKMHVPKFCSILLLRCCWNITNNNASINLYKFVVRSSLRIIIEPLITLIPPSTLETCTLELPKLPTREDSFLNLEHVECSWGFELVHQTSSYGCYRCQQSCTRHHYPSGQSLHHKTCKYWTTFFLNTCGMCTPNQVTKHLNIYLFLTQPSRHHMDPHLLVGCLKITKDK